MLNTLGMAQIALGEVDEGVASLRQAIAIAERNEDADGITYAYANLADLLNLRGRGRGGAAGRPRGAGEDTAPAEAGPRVDVADALGDRVRAR